MFRNQTKHRTLIADRFININGNDYKYSYPKINYANNVIDNAVAKFSTTKCFNIFSVFAL